MDQVQDPPAHRSTPDDDEYTGEISDTPSSERRKYQRGGRRKSERGERDSRMPPVPEPTPGDEPAKGETLEEFNDRIRDIKAAKRLPKQNGEAHQEPETHIESEAQTNGHDHEEREEEQEMEYQEPDPEDSDAVCDKCKQKPARKAPAAMPAPPRESPFETGIRAFNVKRAQGSGGRPISVRASGSEKGKKSSTKTKKKSKRKTRKVESSSEEESDEDNGEEKRKPVSIKLELNLMIEIFLKAKIKGDVTITFLE